MGPLSVAGIDWAKGQWLAIILQDGSYQECILEREFEDLWESTPTIELALIDVPIGVPYDEKTLKRREELDSLARSVTDRPGSVFPVPSRKACELAAENEDYERVAAENEDEIGKGLNKQSYNIAAGIGVVNAFLRSDSLARDIVRESHPELCFRGLSGEQLQHSKKSAAGVGERLNALERHIDRPGTLLKKICSELSADSSDVEIDDVIDALGLAVTAWKVRHDRQYLEGTAGEPPEDLPMRMAYWSEKPLNEIT